LESGNIFLGRAKKEKNEMKKEERAEEERKQEETETRVDTLLFNGITEQRLQNRGHRTGFTR
jgi:hypothetical protein